MGIENRQILKLHRKEHLEYFVNSCLPVIQKGSIMEGSYEMFENRIECLMINKNLRGIYEALCENPVLWKDGYSILLPLNVRATFTHLREMSAKKRLKKLSKEIEL